MTDNAFDALADIHRRRLLLDVLEHAPTDVSKSSAGPSKVVERGEQFVHERHVHLPKLADYGFVEWDRERDVVTRGPRFDEIRPFLKLLDEHRDDLPDGWV